jgi:hypothetical protein
VTEDSLHLIGEETLIRIEEVVNISLFHFKDSIQLLSIIKEVAHNIREVALPIFGDIKGWIATSYNFIFREDISSEVICTSEIAIDLLECS